MSPDFYPNTRKMNNSPPLVKSFSGVEIRSPETALIDEGLVVSGGFHIPVEEARKIDGQLHRALVLVVTREPLYHVAAPFKRILLFDDDEEGTSEGRRGWFNFDIFKECDFRTPGEYFITVSLGMYLSNTLRVIVNC